MRPYRFALGVLCFAAMFAGCTGTGSLPRLAQPLAAPDVKSALHVPAGESWILPDAKKQDLIYVSDVIAQVVWIYTFHGHHKLVGMLTGFFNAEGLCVDRAGDVYVTNDTSYGVYQITEYAHGSTTAMRTLNDPDGRANGCSVDPVTGNLAVANFWGASDREGNVAVYPNASGSPIAYSNQNIYYYYYCGYDDNGNLFVDGETQGSVFGLGELSKGGNALNFVNVDETIYLPGGVEWDGKYLAVGDQVAVKNGFHSTVYQFAIGGSQAKTVNTMTLLSGNEVAQFWIPRIPGHKKSGDKILLGTSQGNDNTPIWTYPSGGYPIETISGETSPIGVTVSFAKKW